MSLGDTPRPPAERASPERAAARFQTSALSQKCVSMKCLQPEIVANLHWAGRWGTAPQTSRASLSISSCTGMGKLPVKQAMHTSFLETPTARSSASWLR